MRVLCVHQCIEGAVCGPPPGFTFCEGEDVVRTDELPDDVALVLSGHIHRHQVLRSDLRGRPLAAPVVYAGSVERTFTVRAAMAEAPPDVVLQLRVPLALAGSEALRAARLRALAPQTANVTVSVRGLRPRDVAIARGR